MLRMTVTTTPAPQPEPAPQLASFEAQWGILNVGTKVLVATSASAVTVETILNAFRTSFPANHYIVVQVNP